MENTSHLRHRCIFSRAFSAIVQCLMAMMVAGALHAAPAGVHSWKSIEYPKLPVPGVDGQKFTISVRSGLGGDDVSCLRFDILWSGARDASLPGTLADASKIRAQLHLSDGKIVPPQAKPPNDGWGGAGSRGMTWSLVHTFPWQKNTLEEAWIELNVPGQTYWIELPYGFTRKPSDPLIPDPEHGWPAFPPAMKVLGEKDLLVPWLHVNYDLGEIQNHWRLSLELANPFDARAEAILYRDDSQVGKSMFLWKLDTPRTAMEIKMPGDRVLAGHGMGIRLHEDGMRRSDSYSFNRDSSVEKGRDWGKVVIKVDDQTYECVVPSSLFKYVHGVTDNENTKRLPRPQQEK